MGRESFIVLMQACAPASSKAWRAELAQGSHLFDPNMLSAYFECSLGNGGMQSPALPGTAPLCKGNGRPYENCGCHTGVDIRLQKCRRSECQQLFMKAFDTLGTATYICKTNLIAAPIDLKSSDPTTGARIFYAELLACPGEAVALITTAEGCRCRF